MNEWNQELVFFEKIEVDKRLDLSRKKREELKYTKSDERKERPDTTQIKRQLREYYEKLHANRLDNLLEKNG